MTKFRNWRDLAWNVFGYVLLAFCTALFSLSCLMGKQSAAVQLLLFCTVLLYALPPHSKS